MNAAVSKTFELTSAPLPKVADVGPLPAGQGRPVSLSFDSRALLGRVDGEPTLVRNLVRSFSVQWSGGLKEIASAVRRRDGATVQVVAHRMKTSLASIGAGTARRLAEDLEDAGRNGKAKEMDAHHVRLTSEIDRLLADIKAYADDTQAA